MARPRKAPAAAPPSDVVAECLWPNVWTSRGKMLRGQTLSIPADEFKALDGLDGLATEGLSGEALELIETFAEEGWLVSI